jgi:hypothetical protein
MGRKTKRIGVAALASIAMAGVCAVAATNAFAGPPFECTTQSGNCERVLVFFPWPHYELVCKPPCNMGN